MATIITKNSSTASSVPLNTQLVQGELAVNVTDKRLFTENASGTVVELGTNPSSLTLPNGTANGLAFLNASKVLTTGSALTYNGSVLGLLGQGVFRVDGAGTTTPLVLSNDNTSSTQVVKLGFSSNGVVKASINAAVWGNDYLAFNTGSDSEQMRLTSTGLGIGTSSPAYKLQLNSGSAVDIETGVSNSAGLSRFGTRGSGNSFAGSFTAGKSLELWSAGSLNATLDSSGNLGLGVTPSAWFANSRAIDIGTGGAVQGRSNDPTTFELATNAYLDSAGAWRYKTTNRAGLFALSNGSYAWNIAGSGTAGAAISFTQAMTLDASGNLGVGTTSPSNKLHVYGAAGSAYIRVEASDTAITGKFQARTGTGLLELGAVSNTPLAFVVNDTERARIDSSGNLLVATTSQQASAKVTFQGAYGSYYPLACRLSSTSSDYQISFVNPNGIVGNITSSGSSTAYNTSSDYRLKENIQPMTGALAKVSELKPVTYKWKSDGSDGEGFIAHELQAVVPQCVTGEKDAVDAEGNPVYQGIDTSFLVATLTAAIQELKASLDEVKLEFDAYKAAHP